MGESACGPTECGGGPTKCGGGPFGGRDRPPGGPRFPAVEEAILGRILWRFALAGKVGGPGGPRPTIIGGGPPPTGGRWRLFIGDPTSNIQHRTFNIEHSTSNIQHPAFNIQHSTSIYFPAGAKRLRRRWVATAAAAMRPAPVRTRPKRPLKIAPPVRTKPQT